MKITNRDKLLLQKLLAYGLLTTKQIEKLIFSGVAITTILRRLRILESAGLIQRIKLFEAGALAWCVTAKGGTQVGATRPKKSFRPDHLDHELKLVALRLALESAQIAKTWIPEHEIRYKVFQANGVDRGRNMLVPDGIIGVRSAFGVPKSVAIELELNFKNAERWSNTFHTYSYRKNLGYLWFVTQDASIGRAALKAWQKASSRERTIKFYWSELTDVLANPTTAVLHGIDVNIPILEAWSCDLPAQSAAQGVSGLGVENKTAEITVNP